jgi:hypothetical protein
MSLWVGSETQCRRCYNNLQLKGPERITCRPVPMVETMTLEQALAFRIYGKALREIKSPSEWRRLFLKIEERQAMMGAFWRHQWDDEMDQRAHASADQLDDLMTALGIIFHEV